jgi:ferritin-like metal-binding protein YciE
MRRLQTIADGLVGKPETTRLSAQRGNAMVTKASSNAELRQEFEEHLRQTSEDVSRLEQIFDMLGEKPTGTKCLGMDGLIKEGSETMQEDYEDGVMDAAFIGAAQRVKHYEIAGYAELLRESEPTRRSLHFI